MSDEPAHAGTVLRLVAMGAILMAALVRAMSVPAGTPYWDIDPLLANVPETGLLPSIGFLLDALVWLAAGAAIVGEALAGRRVLWRTGVLVGIGAVGVLLHGLVLAPIGAPGLHGDFESLQRGSAWAAAMVGAWAFAHLGRDAEVRRAAGVTLLGFVIVLAGVGLYQYFPRHAMTVRQFDADPAAALAAQGMEPGTTAARVFERRMRQPEAFGWFVLANVYGSFAAAGLVGWIAIAVACGRARRRGFLLAGAGACAASAGALVMSGSKGAVGAAILGVALVCLASIGRLRPALAKWGGLAGLVVVAAPLAAVALRGAIGERIGELSLLFRAQYALGALRILAEHPLTGVGPAGFKIAYAMAKVPASPEWVDSPHSLLLDWGATLGLFGIAWMLAWLWWVFGAGRALSGVLDEGFDERPTSPVRPAALLAILLAILYAWRLDQPTTMPTEMAMRAICAVLWIGLLFLSLPVPRIALAAAALALGAHMQIEMTGVRTNSALPAMLLIGLAAAPAGAQGRPARAGRRIRANLGAGLAAAMGLTVLVAAALPALRWEEQLRQAAQIIHAEEPPVSTDTILSARKALLGADALAPSEREPLLHAARLALVAASGLDPAQRTRLTADAVADGERAAARFSADSIAWSRLGAIHQARFSATGEPGELEAAAHAWARAAALDPLALTPAVQCWRLDGQLGRTQEASKWGRRALEVDALLHLDPVVQLSPRMRTAIEVYLSGGEDSGPLEGSSPETDE